MPRDGLQLVGAEDRNGSARREEFGKLRGKCMVVVHAHDVGGEIDHELRMAPGGNGLLTITGADLAGQRSRRSGMLAQLEPLLGSVSAEDATREDSASGAKPAEPQRDMQVSLRVYDDVTLEDEATGMRNQYRAELGSEALNLYARQSGQLEMRLPLHAFAQPEKGGGLLRHGLANPFWIRAQVNMPYGPAASIKFTFAGRSTERDEIFKKIAESASRQLELPPDFLRASISRSLTTPGSSFSEPQQFQALDISPPSGRCWKQKPTLRTWPLRYIRIFGKALKVYAAEGDADPRGSSISDVTGCVVATGEHSYFFTGMNWETKPKLTLQRSDLQGSGGVSSFCFETQSLCDLFYEALKNLAAGRDWNVPVSAVPVSEAAAEARQLLQGSELQLCLGVQGTTESRGPEPEPEPESEPDQKSQAELRAAVAAAVMSAGMTAVAMVAATDAQTIGHAAAGAKGEHDRRAETATVAEPEAEVEQKQDILLITRSHPGDDPDSVSEQTLLLCAGSKSAPAAGPAPAPAPAPASVPAPVSSGSLSSGRLSEVDGGDQPKEGGGGGGSGGGGGGGGAGGAGGGGASPGFATRAVAHVSAFAPHHINRGIRFLLDVKFWVTEAARQLAVDEGLGAGLEIVDERKIWLQLNAEVTVTLELDTDAFEVYKGPHSDWFEWDGESDKARFQVMCKEDAAIGQHPGTAKIEAAGNHRPVYLKFYLNVIESAATQPGLSPQSPVVAMTLTTATSEPMTPPARADHSELTSHLAHYLNSPGSWDIMLSYTQRNAEAKLLVEALYTTLQSRGKAVWLDIKMTDKSEAAMKEAAQNSACVVAVVTGVEREGDHVCDGACDSSCDESDVYFQRKYCISELRWAREVGVPIKPVIRREDRHLISQFLRQAPADLGDLRSVNFETLDRINEPVWDTSIDILLKSIATLQSQPAQRWDSSMDREDEEDVSFVMPSLDSDEEQQEPAECGTRGVGGQQSELTISEGIPPDPEQREADADADAEGATALARTISPRSLGSVARTSVGKLHSRLTDARRSL